MTKKNSNLSDQQKKVLFEEATEAPGSSELNFEKREGSYYCANCETKLFDSNEIQSKDSVLVPVTGFGLKDKLFV